MTTTIFLEDLLEELRTTDSNLVVFEDYGVNLVKMDGRWYINDLEKFANMLAENISKDFINRNVSTVVGDKFRNEAVKTKQRLSFNGFEDRTIFMDTLNSFVLMEVTEEEYPRVDLKDTDKNLILTSDKIVLGRTYLIHTKTSYLSIKTEDVEYNPIIVRYGKCSENNSGKPVYFKFGNAVLITAGYKYELPSYEKYSLPENKIYKYGPKIIRQYENSGEFISVVRERLRRGYVSYRLETFFSDFEEEMLTPEDKIKLSKKLFRVMEDIILNSKVDGVSVKLSTIKDDNSKPVAKIYYTGVHFVIDQDNHEIVPVYDLAGSFAYHTKRAKLEIKDLKYYKEFRLKIKYNKTVRFRVPKCTFDLDKCVFSYHPYG